MATGAKKLKVCSTGFVYLVPGRTAVNDAPSFSASPPAEAEIGVDAMIADGLMAASHINPAVTVRLPEPRDCGFVMVGENLRPNESIWDFPTAGSKARNARTDQCDCCGDAQSR